MAHVDYAGWAARAVAFTVGVGRLPGGEVRAAAAAAPAAEGDMKAVERALGVTIPASLRELFTRGSAGVECAYVLEPDGQALDRLRALLPEQTRIYGGARLGPASALRELSRSSREWAEETWVAEDPDQRIIWESALPFASLENGDYLALDLRDGAVEPPVVYLNHDDESVVLGATLGAFLDAWERLCYLGPEHWLLQPFIGTDGYLDPASDRAAQLRGLFTH
jgi:hypothetical protein